MQAGNAWRNGRWESFTLVTPNWAFRIPGAEYQGDQPGGFMPRDEVVSRFERYVTDHELPVRFGTRVTSIERDASGDGYILIADDTGIEAANVVIATGLFQSPKVLAPSADMPGRIAQLHSSQYRNPGMLDDGAVLVVGSAQSGCQIAQELYQSGRTVYLCVGGTGRVPRRYRDRDIFDWMLELGFFDRTVDDLPSPRARFAGNPHVSGRDGGQSLNLHQFARDGVILLGHLKDADGETIRLSADLKENLKKADDFEHELVGRIDSLIAQTRVDAPTEELPALRDGYLADEIIELNLKAAGITSIVWAIGYMFDFSLVRLPVFDTYGYPVQKRGVTEYPGLFFVGLPWLHKQKSGLLVGVGEDAEFVASAIAAREM